MNNASKTIIFLNAVPQGLIIIILVVCVVSRHTIN